MNYTEAEVQEIVDNKMTYWRLAKDWLTLSGAVKNMTNIVKGVTYTSKCRKQSIERLREDVNQKMRRIVELETTKETCGKCETFWWDKNESLNSKIRDLEVEIERRKKIANRHREIFSQGEQCSYNEMLLRREVIIKQRDKTIEDLELNIEKLSFKLSEQVVSDIKTVESEIMLSRRKELMREKNVRIQDLEEEISQEKEITQKQLEKLDRFIELRKDDSEKIERLEKKIKLWQIVAQERLETVYRKDARIVELMKGDSKKIGEIRLLKDVAQEQSKRWTSYTRFMELGKDDPEKIENLEKKIKLWKDVAQKRLDTIYCKCRRIQELNAEKSYSKELLKEKLEQWKDVAQKQSDKLNYKNNCARELREKVSELTKSDSKRIKDLEGEVERWKDAARRRMDIVYRKNGCITELRKRISKLSEGGLDVSKGITERDNKIEDLTKMVGEYQEIAGRRFAGMICKEKRIRELESVIHESKRMKEFTVRVDMSSGSSCYRVMCCDRGSAMLIAFALHNEPMNRMFVLAEAKEYCTILGEK